MTDYSKMTFVSRQLLPLTTTPAQRASRLRLSFRGSAALVASMLYVLTGLAGYVMAEHDDPNAATTALLVGLR